jgi:hypothetical protein
MEGSIGKPDDADNLPATVNGWTVGVQSQLFAAGGPQVSDLSM